MKNLLLAIFAASTALAGSCVPDWGACAGSSWNGEPCCQGLVCDYQNEWYSQCIPGSSGGDNPPEETEPPPTEPAPTDPAPTDPAPTDPAPTDPAPTDPAPTDPAPPPGGSEIADWISADMWDEMFPHRGRTDLNCHATSSAFSYAAFIEACKAFPAFGNVGSENVRKQEVAGFLGQTSQETSGHWGSEPYIWGYCYSEEIACIPPISYTGCAEYCQAGNSQYPCQSGESYHGRGPIQLSWNYNYGLCSEEVYGDEMILLKNPDQVLSDGVTSFHTALWFWFTPQWDKPSCHAVMTGQWEPSAEDAALGRHPGLGQVTNIINGGYECGTGTRTQASINRVEYHSRYAALIGVPPGDNLYCENSMPYW